MLGLLAGRNKTLGGRSDISAVMLQAPENEKVLTCGALLSDATELPQDHMVRCPCVFVQCGIQGHCPCTDPLACLAVEAPMAKHISSLWTAAACSVTPTVSSDGLFFLARSSLLSSKWA